VGQGPRRCAGASTEVCRLPPQPRGSWSRCPSSRT
jgi:hypothetical protein